MVDFKYIKATQLKNKQSPPIWFMRQAGRYLPEYKSVRKNYTFNQMISNPDIVTEITLQPIKRYDFDAAILYSDILVVPNAFGLHFDFIEKKGPVLQQSCDISFLKDSFDQQYDIGKCQFVFNSVRQLKTELNSLKKPLIGFAGCPFTVACYLVEGQSSKSFSRVKDLIKHNPAVFLSILDQLTAATIDYLSEQANAGVDAIQLFDTWACLLEGEDYINFTFNHIEKICNALKPFNIPIILFSKNTRAYIKQQMKLPINVIGIDSYLPLKEARQILGNNFAVQGNLSPELLLSSDTKGLTKAVKNILSEMKNDPGFIFNLGHGILPTTPLENVELVVDLVKNS